MKTEIRYFLSLNVIISVRTYRQDIHYNYCVAIIVCDMWLNWPINIFEVEDGS